MASQRKPPTLTRPYSEAIRQGLFRNFLCLQPQQDFMLRVGVRLGKAPPIESQIFQVDELFHSNPPQIGARSPEDIHFIE
jgi:hypothetical protein